MARCEVCGKGPQFGHNRPFSLKATNRRFSVNIQKVSIYEGGRQLRCLAAVRMQRVHSTAERRRPSL